jgi:hypothetical protein
MVRRIGEVIAAIFYEWQQLLEDIFSWEDPKTASQNQLRRMYGQGVISAERFLDLLTRLERDQIGLGDIQMVHQASTNRLRAEGQPEVASFDPQVARSLDRLYLDRGLVAEAGFQIQRSLASLEAESYRLQAQIDAAHPDAQTALPDEAAARTHLATWQRLTHAALEIDVRRAAVFDEQRRIAEMDTELRAAIANLKLLDAQGLVEVAAARNRLAAQRDLLSAAVEKTQGQAEALKY